MSLDIARNPRLQVFQVSATRGDGLEAWSTTTAGPRLMPPSFAGT